MPKILTAQHLRNAHMPSWDIETFTRQWPDGCEITPENYKTAKKLGLSPETFIYAVAPDRLLSWYTSAAALRYDKMAAFLHDKHAREDAQLLKERADAEIEYYCGAIEEAVFGAQP